MNKLTLIGSLALLLLAAGHAGAGTAEIGDDINARIARAKVQQVAAAADRRRDLPAFDAGPGRNGVVALGGSGAAAGRGAGAIGTSAFGPGCNIAIGTVFEDRARAGTAARRETTVIVTGDVIQVGNTCR